MEFVQSFTDFVMVDWSKVEWSQLWSLDSFEWKYGVTPFSHIQIPVVISILYLITLFTLQNYMKDKKPVSLRGFTRIHNIFLTVLSFFMTTGAAYGGYLKYQREGLVDGLVCEQNPDPMKGAMWFWTYIFYLSKFYELIDSYLLVLKKKPLIFLHVWHHFVMPYVCWAGLHGKWCMALWVSTVFNAFVHVLMYTHYTLADLGFRCWWKRYLTSIQISQFLSGVFFTTVYMYFYFQEFTYTSDAHTFFTIHVKQGCTGEIWAVFGMYFVNNSFLFLFIKWYYDNYIKNSQAAGKKKTQ